MGVVVLAFNPGTLSAEAGGSVCSRPARVTQHYLVSKQLKKNLRREKEEEEGRVIMDAEGWGGH